MKILIDNSGYGLTNSGDVSMLIMASSKLRQQFPYAEIRIFTNSADDLSKHIPYAVPVLMNGRRLWYMKWNVFGGLHKILPSKVCDRIQYLENILKIKYTELTRRWIQMRLVRKGYDIKEMRGFLNEVKQADIVVATGGGYVTDSFEEHACALLQTLALAQSYGKPTAMFGQGLGPITSKRLLVWTKYVLPKLKNLSLREGLYSKPLALSVGVSPDRVHVSGDDAICMAYSKTPLSIGNHIGINLRVASYSGLEHNTLKNIKIDLNTVVEEIGAKLCGIPIALHGNDSDINSLTALLEKKLLEDAKKLCTPEDVIKQIGKCRIVITGSYHAGLFALSQGISVIGIASNEYYRYKFEGLKYQFGDGCMILDRNNPDFNEKFKLVILDCWKKAESVRSSLLERAKIQVESSKVVYQSLIIKS